MSKSVKNIIDISEGINSDVGSKVISDNSVVEAININIDNPGKIKPAVGFKDVIPAIINTDNFESGLYSFRTDDNSNTPSEYVLIQNGANIMRYDAKTMTLIDSFEAPNPAGMNYSNGSLFIYPKNEGSAKLFKSGNYNESINIDYNNLKPEIDLWLDDNISNERKAGSINPDVSFRLSYPTDAGSVVGRHAKGFVDFTGVSLSQSFAGSFLVYKGVQYFFTMEAGSGTSLAQSFANAINANSQIPLTASFAGHSKLLVTSEINGSEGIGVIEISVDNDPDIDIVGYIQGGSDPTFDPSGNINRAIPSGKYSFSASYVLWDGSETNIGNSNVSITFDDIVALDIQLIIFNTSVFNEFIKGVKFYMESESFEFSLLAEYKNEGDKKFKFYNEDDFTTNSETSHKINLSLPLRSTFRFESGTEAGELTSPKMKKFIIVNNRGYAFNVNYNDNWHQDRIIISPQGKPYLLPEKNNIDIVTEDGDEYITAESYGPFLFCFKRLTLFILNIGSNDPSSFFLSDSIFGAGVINEASVCKTEIGIFWANKNGIYLHNGESIRSVSFNRIENEWKEIESDVIRCGYDVINKKAIAIRGNQAYSFDIRNGSISLFDTLGTSNKSNMIVRDEELSIIVGNKMKKFSLDSDSVGWSFTTKDYDLGRRAVRKKVRRFYVTFEDKLVNLNNFALSYALDNTGNFNVVPGKFINNDGTDKNTIAMFDLPRSITAYSVQLKIVSFLDTSIKDISIIYRDKLPK